MKLSEGGIKSSLLMVYVSLWLRVYVGGLDLDTEVPSRERGKSPRDESNRDEI